MESGGGSRAERVSSILTTQDGQCRLFTRISSASIQAGVSVHLVPCCTGIVFKWKSGQEDEGR